MAFLGRCISANRDLSTSTLTSQRPSLTALAKYGLCMHTTALCTFAEYVPHRISRSEYSSVENNLEVLSAVSKHKLQVNSLQCRCGKPLRRSRGSHAVSRYANGSGTFGCTVVAFSHNKKKLCPYYSSLSGGLCLVGNVRTNDTNITRHCIQNPRG